MFSIDPLSTDQVSEVYLSRLRISRLECLYFGGGLGAKVQD